MEKPPKADEEISCKTRDEHYARYTDQLCLDRDALREEITRDMPGIEITDIQPATKGNFGKIDMSEGPDFQTFAFQETGECTYHRMYGDTITRTEYGTLADAVADRPIEHWQPQDLPIFEYKELTESRVDLTKYKDHFKSNPKHNTTYTNIQSAFKYLCGTIGEAHDLGWNHSNSRRDFGIIKGLVQWAHSQEGGIACQDMTQDPLFYSLPRNIRQIIEEFTRGDGIFWTTFDNVKAIMDKCDEERQ